MKNPKHSDIKIEHVEKITDYNHLNLFSVEYRDRDETAKKWIFSSRSKNDNPLTNDHCIPDAVVIVPYHAVQKKLVLIKEFRVALADYQYGFPAGLVDPGEKIETAAERELFEETGLKIKQILRKSPPVYSSSGMTDESVALCFVECEGMPTSRYNEASEDIDVLLVSPDDAAALLADDRIKFDVKTWVVLNGFVMHGSIQ